MEREVFKSKEEATRGLKILSDDIAKESFPDGSIKDPSHHDRMLVPVGDDGFAVYQVGKNRTAKLKTVLIRKNNEN